MKSLKGQIIWKNILYICIILLISAFLVSYIIQRKIEDSIPSTLEFIRDTKYVSLNKDNLQTAYEFNNLNYTSFILNENGETVIQTNFKADDDVKTFCKNNQVGTTSYNKDGLKKYISIKKNGQLCLVIAGNTNTSTMIGKYILGIFAIFAGIFTLLFFFFLWRVYRRVANPIQKITENTENSLVSKWDMLQQVDTKILELQNLDKYSKYLIEMLKQKSGHENSEKIAEIREFQSKFLNKKFEKDANKFRLAVDSAADIVLIVDKFGYINYANKTTTKIIGLPFEEMENKKITDIWHKEDDINVWRENYDNVAKNKTPTQFSTWGTKKNGLKFEASVQITPIKNEDESVDNFLVVERDVTEEKQKERIKSEFISVVSHELRTPMTVIRGYSTLLAEGKLGELNDKQKEYVNKINQETGQLLELANDMLDIQKFESGRIDLKFERANIPEFVNKIVESETEMFNKKNLQLSLENNLKNEFANIDIKYFSRVLTNLLSNAYKYTEKGEVKIFLVNPDTDNIVIAVKDTGVGIKEESLNHLFERFYQADGVLQRKQEGSGLGLSIVKKVVESHNGMVWVESKLGIGSTFYVAIPIAK